MSRHPGNRFVPALAAILSLAAFALAAAPARAASPAYLVRDLLSNESTSSLDNDAEPSQLTILGNKVIFLAQEPSSGQEVWVSDGSSGGTEMLADLCPGPCSSKSRILGTQRGLVYWVGEPEDASYSSPLQLWRSDGTRAGTFPLNDPGTHNLLNQKPDTYAFTSRHLYFTACAPDVTGCAIWRTDGTAAGTVRVAAATPLWNGEHSIVLRAVGDRVFYTSRPSDGVMELWITDGTPAGTRRLKTFGLNVYPSGLTGAGNRLFFFSYEDGQGQELWTSDGTAAGTRAVTQFPEAYSFGPGGLWPSGNRVYFIADDVTHGRELWRSDGTTAGTVRITEFGVYDPFTEGAYASDDVSGDFLVELGARLVFIANDGLHGYQLWSTSGTPESTQLVHGLCEGESWECARYAIAAPLRLGDRVVFLSRDRQNGREPWSTDGTPAGTRRLADICPGACDGALSGLAPIPGGAAFLARELPFGSTAPTLLWRTDGTAAGTRLLANPGLDASILGGDIYLAKPLVAGAPGGRIYFSARSSYGLELWTSDGTARGTRLITDLARKDAGASPSHLTALGDRLFFTACSEGFGFEVWQTAGSPESTQAVTDFDSGCYSSGGPAGLTAAGGLVFFSKVDYETDEVWRSDGTAAGLQRVALLTGPQKLASPRVPLGHKIFFLVGDDTDGRREVWKSDGTAAGTGKAFDLPGLTSILRVFGTGQELFLTGITAGGDPELWISDGTAAGSRKLLSGSQVDNFHTFVRVGATVLFGSWNGSSNEVWRTDGTAAGTGRVADLGFAYRQAWDLTAHGGALYFFTADGNDTPTLWRATAASVTAVRTFVAREWLWQETYLTSFNGLLYFVADDGTGSGGEVWKSDGTPAGTGLLRDIAPGRNDSRPRALTVAGGRLYFTANDGVHGAELWQTDGTVTRLVQDIAPEGLSSSPSQLTAAGGRLYFVADDGLTGPELWALPLGATAAECRPSPHRLCLGGRYQVEVAWKDFQGRRGVGTAAPVTADTGYFWFFDPANVEVIIKVLDGQGLNGHRWVFYGALSSVEYTLTVTDVQTGLTRRYFNPAGTFASVGDTQAFGRLGAFSTAPAATSSAAPPLVEERVEPAAAGTCQAGPQRLCLNDNRFAVEVAWKDFQGRTGKGQAVPLSGDTGYFWFFNASNVELVTKALDGTALNGKYWFFYGALSNVEYRITVTDTVTGKVKTYTNPAGRFASVGDTGAF